MDVAGVYRTVRHGDHAVPDTLPRPLVGADHPLDIRAWTRPLAGTSAGDQGMAAFPDQPWLLVGVSRRMGGAVVRTRFKRRVRMAALELLRRREFAAVDRLVLFVRPGRSVSKGRDIPYADILHALSLALSRV